MSLPNDAEGAFRIAEVDAFDHRFSIHVYGAGRRGWFAATYRSTRLHRETGLRPLPKGEWIVLQHHAERAGFWSLPPDGSQVQPPAWMSLDGVTEMTLDGSMLAIAGRMGPTTYHEIRRNQWWEPGLDAIRHFGYRHSGFFARRSPGDRWQMTHGPDPLPPPDSGVSHPARDCAQPPPARRTNAGGRAARRTRRGNGSEP